MSEKSTTPDLVELVRQAFEGGNSHDVDAIMDFNAPDAVWDLSDLGVGTFEGAAAIRGFIEDWWGTWGDHAVDVQTIIDVSHGVVFSHVREDGRLGGSDGRVEQQRGWVFLWVHGEIERIEIYLDADKARPAAEQLAESRG